MTATTTPEADPARPASDRTGRRLGWRGGRFDPLVPLTGLVALAVYLTHGFDGGLSRDLGVYTYGGQQFAEGVPPYVAIVNRAGPLAHLLPGIGAWISRLVGLDDVLGMRMLFWLFAGACVAATYVLVRDVFRSRLAGVTAAAALLCVKGFVIYATYGPREKTPLTLFCLLSVHAMVRRRWAAAGFWLSLGTLTWQPCFFPIVAGLAVAALLQPEGRVRSLARIAVGGLVPLVVTVGAYAVLGDLKYFLDDFVIINARYTRQVNLLESPHSIWLSTLRTYGWTTWLLVGGLVLEMVLAVRSWRAARRGDRVSAAFVGMGAITIVGALWSLLAYNGWPDCFFIFPVVMVGIGSLVPLVGRHLSLRALQALVAAWAVAAVVLTSLYAVATRSHDLSEQRSDVDNVLRTLPGAHIMSVEAPPPLVLAHQRNPSRYQLFGNGLIDYVDATWPGGREGYARFVDTHAPQLLAVGTESGIPDWLRPVLDQDFTYVGESPGWYWFVRDEVGQQKVHELQRVLDH